MKYHGIEGTRAIFNAHNTNGVALNRLLEDRGISSPRVILTAPRELEVVDGNFMVVSLPVVEEALQEVVIEETVE